MGTRSLTGDLLYQDLEAKWPTGTKVLVMTSRRYGKVIGYKNPCHLEVRMDSGFKTHVHVRDAIRLSW